MDNPAQNGKLLGYVQVRVGARMIGLPVEAMRFDRDDANKAPGGFFSDETGACGIIVDIDASVEAVNAQIQRAVSEAVTHLSRGVLN